MQPKSHTLFHFTKNIDFLKDILANGFWPRYCLEDMRWYSGNNTRSAYPIVCFCDIPLSRVDEHVKFYGNYGIGVTREWARKKQLSPVIYLNEDTHQHQSLKKILLGNLKGNGYYQDAGSDINNIMSHIKPIEGEMIVNGESILKEFYQENEWRYAISGLATELKSKPWLYEVDYKNKTILESQNLKSKEYYSLKISPSDIRYIFVKSDSDIPNMVNFIQTNLDYYPSSDIKILLSRIMSFETITRDI
ncbi:abortive infection system antitoxin AbiGi family protein [Aeromonas veronii]|uniref:abortive infection system antitoxin AbiGi family protein n=1 Tax=Aeromonas veronii TaxID=654 RepID=UPI000DE589C9|nr:abortive infection system antitoxin AbiGi family protein [Aeromonas veronii]